MQLTIKGTPVAKGRPRVVKNQYSGKVHGMTPEKTTNYETLVKLLFIESKQKKLNGALKLDVKAYFPIVKSTSKKNRILMIEQKLLHTKKPDGDNILKIIGDALNGLAYDDDSAIVDGRVRKYYSEEPRCEIEITEV